MKIIIIFILFFAFQAYAREIGQTEITTDEGIEVFQNEKYFLSTTTVIVLSGLSLITVAFNIFLGI